MSTSTTLPLAAARPSDAFLSELVSALPIVILYRAVRASWQARASTGGSFQAEASH